MDTPEITYIILNYNPNNSDQITPKFVQCVEALYRNTDPYIPKEVILIDQGSPDPVLQVIEGLRKQYGFTVVQQPKNIGISAGINLGFRMGKGKFLCLVTYDVIVTKGFDKSCLNAMKDPSIFHLVPLSDKGDNPYQVFNTMVFFGSDYVTDRLPGGLIDAGLVELTVNFFSRKCIDQVGYFDERWMACYENMDYIFRTMLCGGRTVINRGAFAWHYHNTASKYVGRNHFYDGMYQGDPFADGRINRLWLDKWGDRINDDTRFDSWKIPSQDIIQKYSHNQTYQVYQGWPQ
jgi:GT2 family glycosyltransferase